MTTGDGTPTPAHPIWTHAHVRYSDLDLNGHVNNVAYADYVAEGRVAFLMHVSALGAEVEPMVLRHLTIGGPEESGQ